MIRERFLILILVPLFVQCSTAHQTISYSEEKYNYTSYVEEKQSPVPPDIIIVFTNRLEINDSYLEIGVLEADTYLTNNEIKEIAAGLGATAIFQKNNNNYLLLRDKHYKPGEI